MPASNQKIITSAVALTQLGPDYRYHTVIAKRGVLKDSVLNGDLIVIGRGDPTMSDRVYGNAANEMLSIADSIRAHGIRHVTGSLRQGGNAFPDSIYGYGWEWDDIGGESGAPVDELLYNEGLVQRTVKVNGRDTVVSVATRTPGYVYLSALYGALTQRGITVDGLVNLTADSLTAAYDTVYIVTSPPLREILKHFMKPSQNQIGEALLKTIGLEKTGIGSADAGVEVETAQLRAWGVDSSQVVVYDGSGLSRHDLVSPETIVKVLTCMQRDTAFGVYYDGFSSPDSTEHSFPEKGTHPKHLPEKGDHRFVQSCRQFDTGEGNASVRFRSTFHHSVPRFRVSDLGDIS